MGLSGGLLESTEAFSTEPTTQTSASTMAYMSSNPFSEFEATNGETTSTTYYSEWLLHTTWEAYSNKQLVTDPVRHQRLSGRYGRSVDEPTFNSGGQLLDEYRNRAELPESIIIVLLVIVIWLMK